MDNGLHFVLTGENQQLLDTLEQSRKAFDALNETASKYGVTVDDAMTLVSQHMQSTAESTKTLSDSMDGVSQAMQNSTSAIESAGEATEDLGVKNRALNLELRGLMTELQNTSTDNVERIKELEERIDVVKDKIAEVRHLEAEQFASSGVQLDISTGDPVEMVGGAAIGEMASDAERLNSALEQTSAKFQESQEHLNATKDAFDQLINKSNENGGDMLKLAENNDKIEAIKERIDELGKAYEAAMLNLRALDDSIKQAVADGNTEQADKLQKTYEQVSEACLKISQETKQLEERWKQLKAANDKIKSDGSKVPENTNDATKAVKNNADELKKSLAGLGTNVTQLGQGLRMLMSGGANAAKGLAMVAAGIKGVFAAIVSNPAILALSALLASVVMSIKGITAAFKRNEDAMNALAKIAAPFKAIWQTIQRLFDDMVKIFVKVNDNLQRAAGGFSLLRTVLAPVSLFLKGIRTALAIIGTSLNNVTKNIADAADFIRERTQNSAIGKFFQNVKGWISDAIEWLNNLLDKVANTKIGKRLGLPELLEDLREINHANSELNKTNKEIADLELARNKKERAALVDNAKHQANLTKLRREYYEAAGDAVKQDELSKKITAEEKAIKKNNLDLAEMELSLIQKKNSLVKAGTQDLKAQAQAEANVIRLRAEYEEGMSSQERMSQRRGKNDEYRKLKGELDSERDLRLEAYKQQKIDARDSRDELQKIEMEEFEFKQTMQKKSLELQLKYHKISQQEYENQLATMAAAAVTHKKQVESGNFDFFRSARIKMENGVLNKNKEDETKAEVDALKEMLKYETSISKQMQIQNVIREKNLQLELDKIELEKRNKIREVYKEEGLRQYDEGTLNDVVGVTAAYDKRKQQTIAQSEREQEQENLANHLTDYKNYFQERLKIAKEYSEKIQKAVEDTSLTGEQASGQVRVATETRNNQMKRLGEKYQGAIGKDEQKLVEDIVRLETSITYGALDEAEKLYSKLLGEIDQQIAKKDAAIADTTAKMQRLEQVEGMLASGTKQQVNPETGEMETVDMTEEDKTALESERLTLLNGQADAVAARLEYERQITAEVAARGELDEARQEVEIQNEEMQQRKTELSNQRVDDMAKKTALLAQMFGSVSNGAKNLADIFGDKLSTNGKKALRAIAGIGAAAKDSLSIISQVIPKMNGLFTTTKLQSMKAQTEITSTNVTGQTAMTATQVGATTTMVATSATAAEAIKNVERASVILAIISAVIQAIQALVSALKSVIKTEEEKIQESIDRQKEALKDLERQQQKLEKAYKRSVGADYFRGMAKAAEAFNEILGTTNSAIKQAQELYESYLEKYGEDSDKTKEAKEQLQELQDNGEDYADKQKEMYDELANELLGTNVTQFSENLADQLVDAWQDGTDDMEEIWDDMLDNMQRDMMKKALSIALTDMFKDTFERISDWTKNGELTQSEIDAAIAEIDAKSAQAQAIAEKWRQAMAERGLLDESDAEGSKGFGQMTQDQADTLTARFTAIQMEGANLVAIAQIMLESLGEMQARSELQTTVIQNIYQFQQLAYMQAQENFDQLQIIADNTSMLTETNSRLRAIEQNTDKL